jgi:hypothetical protein
MKDVKMKGKIFIAGGSKGGVGKSIVCGIGRLSDGNPQRKGVPERTSKRWTVYSVFPAGRSTSTMRKGGSISSTRRNNIPAIMWSSIGKNAARNGKGIASYVDLQADSLRGLEREFVTFWIVNRAYRSIYF